MRLDRKRSGIVNEPTKEQIQKFWQWCGFIDLRGKTVAGDSWQYPNGGKGNLPKLDLNNLFKYAVPKIFVDSQGGIEFQYYPGILRCILTTECEAGFDETPTENERFDPALALFWAIWSVIDGQD